MSLKNEFSSRILRIGLVNSGMFDLLELNMDVQAIHFIAANNVGKTSLIELIQFLYFHDTREMTFSKSITESLAFYFRPEGSYILFEVRTLENTIRTIGIYGKGQASTRTIFVFDGGFKLDDFLTEERHPATLEETRMHLFERRYAQFRRFEGYERALIGQHSDGRNNVRLFDLSTTNFRLLRQLLQGLLRLDRLTSQDAQRFLIQIIRMDSNIQTEINIAQDFESKYRDIQKIQTQLNDARQLAPSITAWKKLSEDIDAMQAQLAERQIRYFHTSLRHLDYLANGETTLTKDREDIQDKHDRIQKQKEGIIERNKDLEREIIEQATTIKEWQSLILFCQTHNKADIQTELDELLRQRLQLQENLRLIRPESLSNLQRQLKSQTQEEENISRLLNQQTVATIWQESGFDQRQQILLKFLASQKLYGLSASVVENQKLFLKLSQQAVNHLDDKGTFHGGGMIIPASEWHTPEEEQEPLTIQLERVETEIQQLLKKIAVAENQQRAHAQLQKIKREIAIREEEFRQFTKLAELERSFTDLGQLQTDHHTNVQAQIQLAKEKETCDQELRQLQTKSEKTFANLQTVKRILREVRQHHGSIPATDEPCPSEVEAIPVSDLREEYRLGQDRIRRIQNDLKNLIDKRREPQEALELRYDREGAERDFNEWIQHKLGIAQEIERIEALLHENYNSLITQVRGKLSNLLDAYDAVNNRITSLNNLIRRVSISNIQQISIEVEESDLVAAIRQTTETQMGLFAARPSFSANDGQQHIMDYLNRLREYGTQLSLSDMFRLEFHITFSHSDTPVKEFEINRFESNGTRTAVKIVLYLGLIKLLQGKKRSVGARIPFFLDEVGSIDTRNLRQIMDYCEVNNFLPIFASPEIRPDIPHNYLFKRNGARSYLESEVIITPDVMGETV